MFQLFFLVAPVTSLYRETKQIEYDDVGKKEGK
jgi:hypothetical protein